MRQSFLLGPLAALGLLYAGPGLSQTFTPARQAAFEAMFANPGDVAAMLRYAGLAAEERAFEDAASTLERVLDRDPGNLAARLDLAIAYYALGVYGLAEYHFDLVVRSGAATPAQLDTIAAYRADADRREAVNTLSGFVEAGPVYSERREATGLSFGVGLAHSYDLGGPVDNAWINEFRAEGLAFDSDLFGAEEFTSVLLRTGPQFALGGAAFSPRLRPYVELERDDQLVGVDTTSRGIGLQYTNPVSDRIAVFASIEGGWFEAETFDPDGTYGEGLVGLTWRPVESTRLRFTLRARNEWSDGSFFDTELIGARIDVQHDFAPGFVQIERDWALYGHAQYDEVDDVSFGSSEVVWNYGVGLRAFFNAQGYVEGEVVHLSRDGGGVVQDDTLVRLSLGLEF